MTVSRSHGAIAAALGLFALWMAATWLLEGRIETLLRPDATAARVSYALVANLLIGIVGGIAVLRFLVHRGGLRRTLAGFGPGKPSALRCSVALALGFGFYLVQSPPTLAPVVLLNAFAQVLVVSAAEIVVCWAVVGATVETLARHRSRLTAWVWAAAVASALFGLYHFAHSPPFNRPAMVGFLSLVGLITSVMFLVLRDVYAVILFHNCLGMLGVLQALDKADRLDTLATLQPPLLITGAATLAVLGLADWALLRRALPPDTGP